MIARGGAADRAAPLSPANREHAMTPWRILAAAAGSMIPLAPLPATASDEAFEFWMNPSVSAALDGDTAMELETVQRLRSAGDGRVDTYYVRLWLNQAVTDALTLSGAVERRVNDGGDDERRLIQQVSTSHGVLRTRLRLEQRFVENRGGRMGLRVRTRLGVKVPLDEAEAWSFRGDNELLWTVRATGAGGATGLTGVRSSIGLEHELSDQLTMSAGYVRAQEFLPAGPDTVGHAPMVALEFAF